jgi:hypothetical protein
MVCRPFQVPYKYKAVGTAQRADYAKVLTIVPSVSLPASEVDAAVSTKASASVCDELIPAPRPACAFCCEMTCRAMLEATGATFIIIVLCGKKKRLSRRLIRCLVARSCLGERYFDDRNVVFSGSNASVFISRTAR